MALHLWDAFGMARVRGSGGACAWGSVFGEKKGGSVRLEGIAFFGGVQGLDGVVFGVGSIGGDLGRRALRCLGGRCEHGERGMGSGEVLGGEGGRARGARAAGLERAYFFFCILA